MDYFKNTVTRLNQNDLKIINFLYQNDCTNSYKSFPKKNTMEGVELSEAQFKKSLNRLEALNFVEIATGQKQHQLFISEYGIQAIQLITEMEEMKC